MANAMLERLDLGDAELSILLTNDETIRTLNREHRHKDRPTDVLSFHLENRGALKGANTPTLLGDIVISLDTAARQARGRKRPLLAELRWLLAHGILHLIGYDHATVKQKREMTAWTRRLVQSAPLPSDASPKRRG
jgi:probable rRNA maturation factor